MLASLILILGSPGQFWFKPELNQVNDLPVSNRSDSVRFGLVLVQFPRTGLESESAVPVRLESSRKIKKNKCSCK